MKQILILVVSALILAQSSFASSADCIQHFKWRRADANIAWLGGGGVLGFFVALPVGAGMAGPAALIVMGSYATVVAAGAASASIKNSRMIRLLTQAQSYVDAGGNSIPGRTLLKLHRKVKKVNPNLTLMDLAYALDSGNKDLSLCQEGDFRFFKDVKQALRYGYEPVELE